MTTSFNSGRYQRPPRPTLDFRNSMEMAIEGVRVGGTRPLVKNHALMMEARLNQNELRENEVHYSNLPLPDLLQRLSKNLHNFRAAILLENDEDEARKHAADASNYLAMILENRFPGGPF